MCMTACVAKIWKKVVKVSPEEVFHHCNPLRAIVLHLAIQMTSNDCETTQFRCKHSASLLGQSSRKSAWETLRGSLKQSPAIGSPWFQLHASFGARSIKAMAAERFHITPQFTNCATRPWMKYPSGQLPESEDKYDSLNKFAEEKLYCFFRPPGRISSNRCRSQPYWMNSKWRRIGFKLPNNSSTNHIKILNYPAYIKINFNNSSYFIYKTQWCFCWWKKMIQIYSNHSPSGHPVIPFFWVNKLLVNWYWKSTSTSGIHCQFLQDSRLPPSGDRCCCGSMDEIHLQKYLYILYTYLICTVYTCVLIINMLYHTVKYIHIYTWYVYLNV